MGLFDAISGIFRSGVDFVTDFGGGAFAAIDERLRGGVLTPGAAAGIGAQAGIGVANLFGDIGTSFITAQLQPGPAAPVAGPSPVFTRFGEPRAAAVADFTSTIGLAPTLPGGPPTIAQPTAVQGPIQRGIEVLQQFGIDLGESVEGFFGFGEEQQMPGAVALPGGAPMSPVPFARAQPTSRVFNFSQSLQTGAITARPTSLLMFSHPITGSAVFYRHAGRPILFSGDLRTCKMVDRVAARARRGRGRRAHHHHPY